MLEYIRLYYIVGTQAPSLQNNNIIISEDDLIASCYDPLSHPHLNNKVYSWNMNDVNDLPHYSRAEIVSAIISQ